MLNKLWGAMIVIGIAVAAFQGKIGNVGTAAIDSSKEAVMLCITMLGVMSMWTGIMNVAKKAGLIDAMTRALRPVLRFLFPDIPREHEANEYIAANIIANVLGLGWAATPYGLKAMAALREWQKENGETGNVASTDMCTFLIINISSLQLIPVNIIAYRSQYGSVHPAAVTSPAIIATLISTLTAILFCKIMCKLKRD
jgi:spore maturation protein A